MSSIYKIKRPDGSIVFQTIIVKSELFLTEGWYDIHQIDEDSNKAYNHIWFLDKKSNMMCYKVGPLLYSDYFHCFFKSREEFERAWELKAFA